ncbi:MAG: RNA polymerase factor sigma-32 [Deltaproteobacteria bacterium]|jgi:RNA polymerase sigma-32 factor|nr:RNA polymerase factor sigma-32 [Deltaproteobacteria bacterium]
MDMLGDMDFLDDDLGYGEEDGLDATMLPMERPYHDSFVPVPREPGGLPNGPVEPGSLSTYLSELRHCKVLTKKEEAELLRRYFKKGDKEAGRALVTANLRLVVKIAMEFQTQWLNNIQDLIQEGNMGLLQALRKFDPSRGVKFGYYASYWIKASILKYIMDNWRMVKVGTTKAQRKLFFNLRKEQERIIREGLDPNPELLADRLGVTTQDVEDMVTRFRSGNEVSLDSPIVPEGEETQVSIIPSNDRPPDNILADRQIRQLVSGKLKRLRKSLDERESFILDRRLMSDEPLTLQELGEEFGVSRERVRQLVDRLKQKVHAFLLKELPHLNLME